MPLAHRHKKEVNFSRSRPKSRRLKTKIHLGCINEKVVVSITLTPGQASDAKEFDAVFLKLLRFLLKEE